MNNKSSPGVTTGIKAISQNCKASSQTYVIKKKSPQNEASTLSHTDLHNPSTDQVRASTCHKILLIKIQMPANYSGSLVPAAKVKSLNSKTKLLIILGIYQKHQSQFNC